MTEQDHDNAGGKADLQTYVEKDEIMLHSKTPQTSFGTISGTHPLLMSGECAPDPTTHQGVDVWGPQPAAVTEQMRCSLLKFASPFLPSNYSPIHVVRLRI